MPYINVNANKGKEEWYVTELYHYENFLFSFDVLLKQSKSQRKYIVSFSKENETIKSMEYNSESKAKAAYLDLIRCYRKHTRQNVNAGISLH